MKKILSAAVVIVLAVSLSASALAHGSHRSGRQTARYSVCSIEDCTLTGIHRHNGTAYSAHHYNDGHDYHEYCEYEDCTLSGYHAHDGEYCFGHTRNDGHSYHRSVRGHH